MRLYEIAEEYAALLDMLSDEEVEEQVIRDTMEAINMEFEDKADNNAKIIRDLEDGAAALKEEEERLHKRRKRMEDRSRWLKNELEANMRFTGKIKFRTDLFSFNIQKNGGMQPIIIDGALEDIPGRFLIPQPPVINNEAVRKLLADRQVDWAHLEPRGESLRIR